ncbi:MAG TPA: tRNA pseudouridine(38-40) synthase TruA [Rhodocyclaceae bacterium]
MTERGLLRIAIGLEYAGESYCGWQRQPNAPSIQACVETAISRIAGVDVAITAAGRTDSGVHASAQVVHADVPGDRPMTAWVRGVNSHLPNDIAVNWAVQVSPDFHARFRATGREYRYFLLNRPTRPAVESHRVGWHHRPLDLEAMQRAAACLIGQHDFSSFRAAECQAKTPVRELRRLVIARDAVPGGYRFAITLEADAFLHHMVRNIVGALVAVGNGGRRPEWVAEVLAEKDRRLAAPTFAPDGLYLSGVAYDAHWGLPAGGPSVLVSP